MGPARKTQTFMINGSAPLPSICAAASARNLRKSQLGGVIFGCNNSTIRECLSKQLFGLPGQHFTYVQNIDPGLPLFLFNYSNRKIHGIFEAASQGQMNINPYGWTTDGSERTPYPAQVQIRVRLQCQPLSEDQFKPIIAANYYNRNHFWFELDHAQASKLTSILASLAVAPSAAAPHYTVNCKTIVRGLAVPETKEEDSNPADVVSSFYEENQLPVAHMGVKVEQDDKEMIYMKLKELANDLGYLDLSSVECAEGASDVKNMQMEDTKLKQLAHEHGSQDLSSIAHTEGASVVNDMQMDGVVQNGSEGRTDENFSSTSDHQSVIAQLIQGMEELKAFKVEQTQKLGYLEQKLFEAESEIQRLNDRCLMLENMSNPPIALADEREVDSSKELQLDPTEMVYLVGGNDGKTCLGVLNSYYTSENVANSLSPMNSVRSYASVAQLYDELYVFGGGNGSSTWYDTVESYSPSNDQWILRPSLNKQRGSLAGATLNGKLFAVGGGNGVECFSDVEMLDLDIGSWIYARSMFQRRFSLAAAELNGALYVSGGYDGSDYLMTAERFDPREYSWTKIPSMNTKRGCHSMVVLNEKLYALGGFDGDAMVSSTEIFDPRLNLWIMGESMNQSRGYAAAAVVKDTIYVIGGVKDGDRILDTVERYVEGQGWQETVSAIGKRCFLSAIRLQ